MSPCVKHVVLNPCPCNIGSNRSTAFVPYFSLSLTIQHGPQIPKFRLVTEPFTFFIVHNSMLPGHKSDMKRHGHDMTLMGNQFRCFLVYFGVYVLFPVCAQYNATWTQFLGYHATLVHIIQCVLTFFSRFTPHSISYYVCELVPTIQFQLYYALNVYHVDYRLRSMPLVFIFTVEAMKTGSLVGLCFQ